MTEIIEFNTERLRLRQWEPPDWKPFSKLNANSQVMEFFPHLLDRSESDEMADHIHSQIAERGWGLWAVEVVNGSPFIGFVGLSIPRYEMPASPCVEIGWRLAREHWGKGYATEAALGALRVGFERLYLTEIVSFTSIHNFRSRAVMERVGMDETKETFQHPRIPKGHPLRSHALYRLSSEQWSSQIC